jgi:hypothetical protein
MSALSKANPWAHYDESAIFEVSRPEYAESVYYGILMNNAEIHSIIAYNGVKDFSSFLRLQELLMNHNDAFGRFRIAGLCSGIGAAFSDKKMLSNEDLAVLEPFNLNIVDKKSWPSFRKMNAEYDSEIISADDAKVLLDTMPAYIEAVQLCTSGILRPDFRGGEFVVSKLKDGKWRTRVEHNPEVEFKMLHFDFSKVNDETAARLAKIKEAKSAGYVMEADIIRTSDFFYATKDGRGICPRYIEIGNRTSGKMLDEYAVPPDEKAENALVDCAIACVEKFGKPEQIAVYDRWNAALLDEFCKATGIALSVENLPCIDVYLAGREAKRKK